MASTADPEEVVRVTADCGLDWTGRREVWAGWIGDRHAHAHNKGRDGLPASCSGLNVAPVPPEVAAGYVHQAEPEREAGA